MDVMLDQVANFAAPGAIAFIAVGILNFLRDRRNAKQSQVDQLEGHLSTYRDEVRMLEKKHRLEMEGERRARMEETDGLRRELDECRACCGRAEARAQQAETRIATLERGQQ